MTNVWRTLVKQISFNKTVQGTGTSIKEIPLLEGNEETD